MNNRSLFQTLFLIPLLLLSTSCDKESDTSRDGEPHPVTITTRSGDVEQPEAAYPHALLLFREAGTGANAAAIEAAQASGAAALPPLSLANGNYTVAALASSSTENLTFTPAIAKGSTFATCLGIGAGAIPDILFATKPFAVSQAATIGVPLQRVVGRAIITLGGVPATPAVKTITLTAGKLTDRFTFDGSHSASSPAGIERDIPLALKAGTTDTYTNGADGTILMPSLAGTSDMPLTLKITRADNTATTKTFTIAGTIRAGITSTITLNYMQPQSTRTVSFTYTPWQHDAYSADVPMDTPADPPTGDIGSLAQGGILCTPNLVLSLAEAPAPLAWSTLTTTVATGGTDPDGGANYTAFATYADQLSTRWDRHPAYLYIKGARAATTEAWHLPSREEWAAIAPNLATLNAALTASGSTPVDGTSPYWTSTESGAGLAYSITPVGNTINPAAKTEPCRVRAVKKIE